MDRAQVVSQTIATFNSLRDQVAELFLESSIVSKSELMIEEYFEAKFNPFVRQVQAEIRSVPLNDYAVVSIDLWVKSLNIQIDELDGGSHNFKHAESVYIHRKYLPELVRVLNDIKLELLENLYKSEALDNSVRPVRTFDTHRPISSGGVSALVAQLINFGVIRQDIPPDAIAKVLAPLMGFSPQDILNTLVYDRENHRYTANASAQELAILTKLIKSISARIENQQSTKEKQ